MTNRRFALQRGQLPEYSCVSAPKMAYARYWGKARRCAESDVGIAFHLLPLHCLDAAVVAEAWARRDLVLLRMFQGCARLKPETLKAWLLFFIGLHDFGKFDIRFQRKAPELAAHLNPGSHKCVLNRSYAHGSAGFAMFREEQRGQAWASHEALAWMKAAAGHHGEMVGRSVSPPIAPADVRQVDRTARAEWVACLRELFLGPAGINPDESPPPVSPMFAGFCCVCDWLASNEEFFPYVEAMPNDHSAWMEARKPLALAALRSSGLVPNEIRASGMDGLFPHRTPRGVQRLASAWPVEPGLTLIEAPTGSGKTEAALAHASALLRAGVADGIVFALPTQATANAMLNRLESVVNRMYDDAANVILAHGRAKYHPLQQRLIDRAGGRAERLDEEDGLAQCARWLAQSRKRVFLGQIGVCTIDQVLLSTLPVRHSFVRSFGVGRSILIVDEVHAYDSYMSGLLNSILTRQHEVGGSAILLSATLPANRREQLLQTYCHGYKGSPADAYPLITRASAGASHSQSVATEPQDERVVAFRPVLDDAMDLSDDLADETGRRVGEGQRPAVICNLVADAQRIARRLRERLGDRVDLFHSRYRFCDRQQIEQRIIELYGTDRPREGEGRVVVATQVVEQSLDLDFDWMITQLCPVDLLFQRIGRLHRKRNLERPGTPECVVLMPNGEEFGNHALIYQDPRLLWRTAQLIRREGQASFPAAYREWIEAVYDGAPWAEEPGELTESHHAFLVTERQRRAEAEELARADMTHLEDAPETQSLTRGTEMGLSFLPVTMFDGQEHFLADPQPLLEKPDHLRAEAEEVNSLSVPAAWKRWMPARTDGVCRLHMHEADDGWSIEIGRCRLRYTMDYGLERELA